MDATTPTALPTSRSTPGSSWAVQMRATTLEQPAHLIRTLTGAILANGGWVLSRGSNDSGTINILFEFERPQCIEIYTTLIAAGLELSQHTHLRLTELCQCTRSHFEDCGADIVSVDLEIDALQRGGRENIQYHN